MQVLPSLQKKEPESVEQCIVTWEYHGWVMSEPSCCWWQVEPVLLEKRMQEEKNTQESHWPEVLQGWGGSSAVLASSVVLAVVPEHRLHIVEAKG